MFSSTHKEEVKEVTENIHSDIVKEVTEKAEKQWGRMQCIRRTPYRCAYMPYLEYLLRAALSKINNRHSLYLDQNPSEKKITDALEKAFDQIYKEPETYSTNHALEELSLALKKRRHVGILWSFGPTPFEARIVFDIFLRILKENKNIVKVCKEKIEDKNKEFQQRYNEEPDSKEVLEELDALRKAKKSQEEKINDLEKEKHALRQRNSAHYVVYEKPTSSQVTEQKSIKLSPDILSRAYSRTRGDGNCFFHSAYGHLNGASEYEEPNAQAMRQEWHDFLMLFSSLKEMPENLQIVMHDIFVIFFQSPELMPSTFDEKIKKLQRDVSGKINDSELDSQILVRDLKKEILGQSKYTWPLLLALVKNIAQKAQGVNAVENEIVKWYANKVQNDQCPNAKSLAIIQELLRENDDYFTKRLRDELKQYAELIQVQNYDEEYNSEIIKNKFIYDERVFFAYRTAILSSSYYVFDDEFPLLAALSNTTIRLWYIEISGQPTVKEISPDSKLQAEIHQLSWQSKELYSHQPREVAIFHEGFLEDGQQAGNHYSRANEQYLQLLTSRAHSSIPTPSAPLSSIHPTKLMLPSMKQITSSGLSTWSKPIPATRTTSHDLSELAKKRNKPHHKQNEIEDIKEKVKSFFTGVRSVEYIKENSEIQIIFDSTKNCRAGKEKLFTAFGEPSETDDYGQRDWRILSPDDDTLAIKYASVNSLLDQHRISASIGFSKSL